VSLSGNTTVSNNNGSLFAISSNVKFARFTIFMNNSYFDSGSPPIQEGGAVTSFQSKLIFMDTANLIFNIGYSKGGAILATESKLYMYGDTNIAHNTASVSGGGIYAYQSELNFKERYYITGNRALQKGGGIYAVSTTTSSSRVLFTLFRTKQKEEVEFV